MQTVCKILFSYLMGIQCVMLLAQSDTEIRARWGQEYKEPANSNLSKIIATDGEGFYALRMHRSGLLGGGNAKPIVEYYNAEMKLLRAKELDLRYKGKDRDFKDVIMIGRQLYLLSYFYNEKHEKTYLFAQKIRHSNLNLEPELVKIEAWDMMNKDHADPFGYHISRDSSKCLVYTHSPFVEQGDKEKFSFHVFDAEMNEIWSKTVKLPYKDENFGVEEYQVDNQGNVYLLGMVYRAGENKLKHHGKPTYYYTILAYTQAAAEPHEFKIEHQEVFISNLTFRIADNGQLICSGFYSEKGTASMKGVYFLNLNPSNKEVVVQNLQPFDFGFLTANLSERNKKRAKEATDKDDKVREPELPNFSLDKLILRSDGGALLIAEQYFVQMVMNNNNSWTGSPWGWGYSPIYYNRYYYNSAMWNSRPDYYYNYNDIIVVNINPAGEIVWSTRIPKMQESRNDAGFFSSYAMATAQDKLYFVYNDHPRNFTQKERRYVASTDRGNSVAVVSTINKSGQLQTAILKGNSTDLTTRPKVCRQIGRKQMAIYGEDGRTYKFAALNLE